MFKFFTKRWVSRKEYDKKESELKSVELAKKEFFDRFFKRESELLDIIEEKEKEIQRFNMKAKNIPVQEINGADVFVLDEKGDVKQILRPEKPKDEEAWVIPFCIGELEKLNKKLTEYTPFNPELKKLTIEEVIYKLSLEMQIQNHVLMTALRHLMGETEK